MAVISKDLGAVTAYAAAVNRGYTGTKEEFETLMASYATVAEQAAESATNAGQSAQSASQSATDAQTAQGTAQQAATDAQSAQASAQGFAQSAQQSAQSASQSAQTAESAKNTAVDAVDGFAAGAQQALDGVNQAGNNWKSLAQAKALDSEAYALGTRDGEDVGSQDETYHNNAKYYAEQGGASAQTATDKAGEAQQSAQTATVKAGEAAQSASAAAESARTLTIDATLTQAGQAADSKAVGDRFPIIPLSTTFFENFNYGIPENVKFYNNKFASAGGVITAGTNTCSLVVKIEPNTEYYARIPSGNRQIVVESTDGDFEVGNTYTKLAVNTPIVDTMRFTTGADANYVLIYFYNGTYDYDANKNSIVITKGNLLPDIHPTIIEDYLPKRPLEITPKDTTFFDAVNYFDPNVARIYTGIFVNEEGVIGLASSILYSVSFPVEPNTTYWFYAPDMNRAYAAENDSEVFTVGARLRSISAVTTTSPVSFTTGDTAKYVFIFFHSGAYDYEANKNSIVLNKDTYYGKDAIPYIPYKHLPSDLNSPVNGANILIFGDSITTCCNITIDANHQTSAYVWRNPSNSYVNGEGNTVRYSMWPKILKESEPCGEIRNYAESGASYKTRTRESGYERQNLHYQIDVAMNDLDNPNGVFEVDDYVPDIIIFALGTNDEAPNDTYESAMTKTVLKSDNATVDVDATLLALDETKFCESARKAFLRVKQAFPMAQIYCSLPIQRANNEINFNNTHDVLKKIAERYGCIVIDGTSNSGIVREFNDWNSLGTYLKDGLHPNEKGQNLLARTIIKAIKAHYMPFGRGFN